MLWKYRSYGVDRAVEGRQGRRGRQQAEPFGGAELVGDGDQAGPARGRDRLVPPTCTHGLVVPKS